MAHGLVVALCIGAHAGARMVEVPQVLAEAGNGLVGDRYYNGNGSFNKGAPGKRQVTLQNALFFEDSGFTYADSRRNIFVSGVELMDLIGKDFMIDEVVLRGIKYCDPCTRPNKQAGIKESFRDAFHDRGGLVAGIIHGGIIRVGSIVIPPKKDY